MICLLCPKCRKTLSVSEAHRGGIGQCPDCGQKFRIPTPVPQPAAAPPPEGPRSATRAPDVVPPPQRRAPLAIDNLPRLPGAPPIAPVAAPGGPNARPPGFPDFELTAPPEPPTLMVKLQPRVPTDDEYETLEVDDGGPPEEPEYDVVAEVAPPPPVPVANTRASLRAAPEPPPVPVAPDDDPPVDAIPVGPVGRGRADPDDEDYDDRPRPRRRRRRRSGGFSLPPEIIPGLGNFMALLLLLGAVWLLLAGLALLVPPLGVFLVLLGIGIALVGNVWFYVVAFQEDFMTGLLCLLLPIYAFIYLIGNQDTAGRPFLVGTLGMLMAASGAWLVGGFGM